MKLKRKWFTLVELIVVVTILAILWTVWFISYNGYLLWVRDSNRLTQLDQMSAWLELYRTKNTLPLPSNNIRVEWNGSVMGYQWFAAQDILDLIDYSKWGRDPKDNEYFTYYISGDRKYFQLLGFLEDSTNQATSLFMPNQAHAADYTTRFYATSGKKLWVFVDGFNTPIQSSSSLSGTTLEFELTAQWTTEFQMIFSDKNILKWTGWLLVTYNYQASCKRIKETWGNRWDTTYTINPRGNNSFIGFCNMTYDGGGWLLVGRSVANATTIPSMWFSSNGGSVTDDRSPYSFAVVGSGIPFSEIMFWNYVSGKDLGDRVYKFGLPSINTSLNGTTTTAVNIPQSTVVWLWRLCTGPTAWNGAVPTEFLYVGHTNKNNGFFFGNASASWALGLSGTGFAISWTANNCTNGALNGTGATYTQGEVFVR
jgi:prepilin-type N-terminal cleavage/methylation domain-containing protein